MNITTVAKRAGVSTATVSRVINNSAVVSPATAARVRKVVRELHFLPDGNARSLGSGRSGMYGLIISDITNPYFPELVKAFEDIAVEHKQEILIANTDYDPERMEHCVIRMLQRKVDGVAIMTSEMADHLVNSLSRRSIPLVFLDVAPVVAVSSVVRVNYASGIQMGVEHLVELGHRDIGFISGPLDLHSAQIRQKAFRSMLKQYKLKSLPGSVQEGNHRIEGGHAAMLRMLLATKRRITAVMGSNDLTAIGAMGALRDQGLAIPHDVSVVGFDGIELGGYTQVPLTTLSVSRKELAALAFNMLYQSSRQSSDAKPVISSVEPTLLIRASTAPPRP